MVWLIGPANREGFRIYLTFVVAIYMIWDGNLVRLAEVWEESVSAL
jgi:hypothetical protein